MQRFLGFGLCAAIASNVFGQGALTPPGAPAPTMKTLQQVEPRIPISSVPFSITNSGSYYFTANLSSSATAINIAASDVTLDLAGFTLAGQGVGGTEGITVSGNRTNIVIRNGTVRSWGFAGIDLLNGTQTRLENLTVITNGFVGIYAGANAVVTDCAVINNGSAGISAGPNAVINNCVAQSNADDGFRADTRSRVVNCAAMANGGDGIEVLSACVVTGNNCDGNGAGAGDGAGVHATGSNNRLESNHLTTNDRGLDIDAANNYVAANTVRGNFDNYEIAAGNQVTILLSACPQLINFPATVVLAGSLTGLAGNSGITVSASDVTIDLAGHSLIGVASSVHGILVNDTATNVTIRNGSIRGWGQMGGNATLAPNIRITEVLVSNCGTNGIAAGNAALIDRCEATANTGNGILVNDNGSITHCLARSNGDDGVRARSGCSVTDCTVALNTGDGIQVTDRCRVINNTCDLNGFGGGDGAGIHATGNSSRITSNHVTDNDRGIDVDGADSVIVQNTADNNTTNYDIAGPGSNVVGPISAGGDPFVSDNPYLNFSR